MTTTGTPRMMLVLLGATGVVVAAVAALALQSWWVLFAVLAVHFVATAFVIAYTLKKAGESHDKPDPVSEARIEEKDAPHRRGRPRDYEVFN
jgi:membrane protein implicated in regulation of membrane protease activity